ncbi:hypothetical protein HME9304_00515 [Flagellimonas maritima]|uniref:Ava_C0101 and related proteins n=1 Tax=Flagellimonas maritima TaxID=1383885 RepID=A0A2Z4LNZ2_9FLAO|nr:DUF5996 family protein [Allomuricauda aurantiaca]AWX43526.1 hypothetical protein HME9304_00515 [Allomuricauda aurantiaca]
MSDKTNSSNPFPKLPLEEWEPTKETLHRYLQIVGKIRLALMPRKNHWWYITLYVNSKGITTRSILYGDFIFEIQFDFIHHQLHIQTSNGESRSFELTNGLSVAEFYKKISANLNDLGILFDIVAKPYDLSDTISFAESTEHKSYDKEYVVRFWQILVQVDQLFKEFSGKSYSKTCPVHIYWHHMDMAVTRFSGKKGPEMPNAKAADKDAYSHEVISFGFWAGDAEVRNPAFYAYAYPSPEGLDKEPLMPDAAEWIESNGSPMAFLSYDALRKLDDSKAALLDFLESAYQAGAKRAGWNIEELTVKPL